MKSTLHEERRDQHSVPIFGYELLREILIPDLLGKDTPEITYWAGKQLARKFPLLSFDEMASFFLEAGWGVLELIEQDKTGMKLELKGPLVERRLQLNENPCFRLEAGFIAERIQSQKLFITEAHDEIKRRQQKVDIQVKWDRKDPENA